MTTSLVQIMPCRLLRPSHCWSNLGLLSISPWGKFFSEFSIILQFALKENLEKCKMAANSFRLHCVKFPHIRPHLIPHSIPCTYCDFKILCIFYLFILTNYHSSCYWLVPNRNPIIAYSNVGKDLFNAYILAFTALNSLRPSDAYIRR